MKISPKTFHTINGTEIIVREVQMSDSKSLVKCIKSYLKNKLIPLTSEEFEEISLENKNWINKFLTGKNDLLLVAEYEGEIIANIDLAINNRKMLKHVGYLGMGVHERWQGQGVGGIILDRLIDWVDKNPAIEIIWLQMFSNNERAYKLYNKYQFTTTGKQLNFIKTEDGKYIDNVIMTRNKEKTNL